jgi:hypothetical protein
MKPLISGRLPIVTVITQLGGQEVRISDTPLYLVDSEGYPLSADNGLSSIFIPELLQVHFDHYHFQTADGVH